MKPITQWNAADLIEFVKLVDKKTWIKAGIAATGAAVIILVFIYPAWFRRTMIKNEIMSMEGQIITVQNLRRRKPELMKMKETSEKFITGIKERLFRSGEVSLLLGEISRLATESQIKIIASKPEDVRVEFPAPFDAHYKASRYDFTVEGGYHQLGLFVSKVESHPKLLRIQLFNIRPREKSPGVHIADMSLGAVSFRRGE